MRSAFIALIAAAGLATVAHAQETAPAATETPPAAAPAAPAMDPAAAPVAPAADPAASPAAPAEAAPPPPSLPTTGDGAAILNVLEKICVPSVRGGNMEQLAKANGFKQNRREGTWVAPLGGEKAYSIILQPSGNNRDACIAEIRYAIGQEAPIVSALNIWSFLHQPELILQANYVAVDPDGVKRVRKSWEDLSPNSSTAVNFSTERKPDDTPLNARYDTGKLFYQERKF